MTTRGTMVRRLSGVCVVAAMALGLAAGAEAGGRIERFLPPNTFIYGGVERLQPGFSKLMDRMRETLPGVRELEQERIVRELARGLRLEDVATVDQFIAQTGLDPNGPAGIAWVLDDPSLPFFRTRIPSILIIFPVRDRARTEALALQRILPEFFLGVDDICRAHVRRLNEAKRAWREANPDAQKPTLTWDDLATIAPGLKPLRCPGGGTYKLGAPDAPVTCSVHNPNVQRQPLEPPLTRQRIGARTIGDVTLVGGRTATIGYALTPTHIILSNNMNVLEDAVHAATGKGPRATLPPALLLGDADGRFHLHVAHLLNPLNYELTRMGQRRPSRAVGRLTTLFRGTGFLTADLRIDRAVDLAASWTPTRNAQTARVLDTPPAKLAAFALVPDTALAAWGTNLGRQTFSVLGDIALLEEPRIAGAVKLVMAATNGDGAFAFMPGAFEGEVPNMLFVLRARDREVAEAAAESWMGMFSREIRARRKPVERSEIEGVEVWSLRGERGQSIHYALAGPFVVFGTDLPSVHAAIRIHAGKARNALVASERFLKLGLPAGPTHLVSFMDTPALIRQIAVGEWERRNLRRNRRCLENMRRIEQVVDRFRREAHRLPANFDELMGFAEQHRRGRIRDWCMVAGENTRLTLDPRTGKVTCPRHGTVENFRAIPPDEPRRVHDEERVFSAFGLWGLDLRVDGGKIKGRGRLFPAPQPLPQPRPAPRPLLRPAPAPPAPPRPPRQPAPAEF